MPALYAFALQKQVPVSDTFCWYSQHCSTGVVCLHTRIKLYAINPQQLTPAQTALQRISEKHPDFEIQTVNTIRPPDIEYTQKSQPLVPVDTPLSIIRKHIPRQSDINKIVKSI